MMDGMVTRRFLQKRLWIATLVLPVALAASAWAMVLALQAQANLSSHAVAVQRLSDAAIRLELTLTRLSLAPERADSDRSGARAAFIDLLAEHRAIAASERRADASAGDGELGSSGDGELASLAREFDVGSAAAAWRQPAAASMPEELTALWTPQAQGDSAALEPSIARVLRMSASIVRGLGDPSEVQRQRSAEIAALRATEVRPALSKATSAMDAEIGRVGDRAILFILALTGGGIAAALFTHIAVFRPLEHAVMRS